MVEVFIALALICFSPQPDEPRSCHNVLVGADTPKGTYILQQRLTEQPFYGGDILQFREDEHEVYAIHRVWLGRPAERRDRRIKSKIASQRKITKGCINVEPAVYDILVREHSTSVLIIK